MTPVLPAKPVSLLKPRHPQWLLELALHFQEISPLPLLQPWSGTSHPSFERCSVPYQLPKCPCPEPPPGKRPPALPPPSGESAPSAKWDHYNSMSSGHQDTSGALRSSPRPLTRSFQPLNQPHPLSAEDPASCSSKNVRPTLCCDGCESTSGFLPHLQYLKGQGDPLPFQGELPH